MLPILLIAASLGQTSYPGHLVIAGGGRTTPAIVERALTLAGGPTAHVLIIPQASSRVDAGQRSLGLWRTSGARRVSVLDLRDRGAALAAVKEADLIWFSGGSQTRLMRSLNQYGLAKAIRERFRQGATVGGTSAGAAVMSDVMLEANSHADGLGANARTAKGLGLWSSVIVDQHFFRRSRFNRLLGAVLGHSDKLGVGIDESTAVVVQGHCFEVIGKSTVMVMDARKATRLGASDGEPATASALQVYILKAGMKFDLEKGLIPKEKDRQASKRRADYSVG